MKMLFPFRWLLVLVMAIGFYGCMSDVPEMAAPLEDGEEIRITVRMPSKEDFAANDIVDSRVSYDDSDLSLKWDTQDKLRLVGYDANGNQIATTSDLGLVGLVNTDKTVFAGREVGGAVKYDIYYLCGDNKPVTSDGTVAMNYEGQTQLAINSTEHLKKFLFLKASDIPAEHLKLETQDILLTLQNSIMRFDLKGIPTKIKHANSLIWNVSKQGEETKSYSLQLNKLQISDQRALTCFLCFSDMNVNAGSTIEVTLKQQTKPNKFKDCSYKLKVNAPITYRANNRYVATVDYEGNKNTSSDRFYYESNMKLPDNIFKQQPDKNEFDNQQGFIDFTRKDEVELEIKDNALKGNTKIDSLIFEGGLHEIGDSSFEDCTNLKKVVLPPNLKEVGDGAFKGCTSLKDVTLQDGLKEIGKNAFEGCTSLESIVLPSSVEEIKLDAFKGCTNLKKVHINSKKLPEITEKYPFRVSDEQLLNPLGLKGTYTYEKDFFGREKATSFTLDEEIKIYVPSSMKDNYEKSSTFLGKETNPWAVYKGHYVGV